MITPHRPTYLSQPKAIPTDKEASCESQSRSAQLLLTLGDLACIKSDWDRAFTSYTQAVDVAKSIDDTRIWWRALNQMGRIRLSQNRFDEALSLFNGVRDVAMKCDGDELFDGLATSMGQKAIAFIVQGQLDLAELMLGQSFETFRLVDSPSRIPSGFLPHLRARGWLYTKQEKYEKAAADHKLGYEMAATVGDEYSQALAAYGMAEACFNLERYTEAAEYAEVAAELFARVEYDGNIRVPIALFLLGLARKKLGMWPQAIALLEEAAALFRAIPSAGNYNFVDICKSQVDELRYMIELLEGPGVKRQTVVLE